jgi:quercetin dioxygenase-like cupin family protein
MFLNYHNPVLKTNILGSLNNQICKIKSSMLILTEQIRKCSGGPMALKIGKPTVVKAAGNKEKIIKEYFGVVNSQESRVSIAKMTSPSGWIEPGQKPDFDEYTVVLKGVLQVETQSGVHEVRAGEAIMTIKGEWVRYSTPGPEGAEYVAVCLPAFSPATVHRDT